MQNFVDQLNKEIQKKDEVGLSLSCKHQSPGGPYKNVKQSKSTINQEYVTQLLSDLTPE